MSDSDMPLAYLAGPYRADTRDGIEANIRIARWVAVQLWQEGYAVLCPHLNTAHFNDDCNAPEEAYLAGYLKMVVRCDLVVLMPNSEDSAGAQAEAHEAQAHGIPVYLWPFIPSPNAPGALLRKIEAHGV